MEDEYWEQFMITGRVGDYLCYKDIVNSADDKYLHENVMGNHDNGLSESKGRSSESDNSYRNGAIIGSYR